MDLSRAFNGGGNTLRIGKYALTASLRIVWVRSELLHRDLHPMVIDDDKASGKTTPTSKVRYREITLDIGYRVQNNSSRLD